jgi:hypothetical protein
LLEALHGETFANQLIQAVAPVLQVAQFPAVEGDLRLQLGQLVG